MPGRAVGGASVVSRRMYRRRGTARRKPCWSAPNNRKELPMTESNSSPESMLVDPEKLGGVPPLDRAEMSGGPAVRWPRFS